MKKILVPTDFSQTAEKAFRFAVNLALKVDGAIVLYHVYTPVNSTFIGVEQDRRIYNAQMKDKALKRLQRLKKKVAGEPCSIAIETIVARSPLTGSILSFARQNEIDLITMGTQGASGLKKVLVGSEASRIAGESPVPVLLIPEKFEWKDPRDIVFATNYDFSELHALQLAIEFAKIYEAGITVVHFFELTATRDSLKIEMGFFQRFADHIKKLFSSCQIAFKPILTDSVEETIENLSREVPYDTMVMVRRNKTYLQKLFSKSFTRAMSYVTTIPLLIVPAAYKPNQNHADGLTIMDNHRQVSN
ncbi:universal stress protein [Segetibacter sp. 3557_3]|uniref:universal stress protein n=1 Tax=Segetibacter sp. 3557_3 TaxID=2547429 RepID=UPI001058BA27|nr:universal stress protein [Segetibacter sp. 3557_3]TDH29242.1 universal stress protein [Segetibacter sp. 3557_3]